MSDKKMNDENTEFLITKMKEEIKDLRETLVSIEASLKNRDSNKTPGDRVITRLGAKIVVEEAYLLPLLPAASKLCALSDESTAYELLSDIVGFSQKYL